MILHVLLTMLAGWIQPHQQQVIADLGLPAHPRGFGEPGTSP
jgi:hypothetical protein